MGGPISRLDQIQDGGRPPFWKKEIRHNSAAVADILTKFGVLVAVVSPQRAVVLFLGYNKIQDGGRPPIWKTENRNNSTNIWDIVIKFGMVVGMDSPQRAVTSLFALSKIQDGGRPPFWKKENLHKSAGIWDMLSFAHQIAVLLAVDSAQRPVMSFLGYNKIKTKSQMAAGKFQMAMSVQWFIRSTSCLVL